MDTSRRILIAGGGIGGVTAALALTRAGFQVAVFERAGVLREVGAGITLFGNAVRVLGELGVGDRVLARAAVLERGELRDRQGRVLMRTPVAELAAAAGAPSVALARSALLEALVNALPEGALTLGREATGATSDRDGATLSFAGGGEERGAVVVGADGIRSVLRARIHGDDPPRYAGYTCWRALAAADPDLVPPGLAFEAWGPGLRFGAVRIDAARVYWFASESGPAGGRDVDARAGLAARFARWHAPIPALVAATDPAAILRGDICDRPPLAGRWGEGRVTLLGDAAHPSTPNLGQGAALAIEDALVLARTLARLGPSAHSLRAYEAARAARARSIVLGSRRLGWIGQQRSASLCAVRDACMRLAPQRFLDRAFAATVTFRP